MTNLTQKIFNELEKRIEDAGFNAITIEMKSNGDRIVITPCTGYGDAKGWNDIEYYLMNSEKINLLGEDSLVKVAEVITNYDNLLNQSFSEIDELKAHIRKYGEDSDWDFISDFHKDLFGHRPHIPHSQIIAWAHSDSRESARFFA